MALVPHARRRLPHLSEQDRSRHHQGGLFGFGAEVVYVLHLVWPYLHAAGAAVAKGVAVEAGKELFKTFADKLRKNDIRPSEPEVSTTETKADKETESEKEANTTPPNP